MNWEADEQVAQAQVVAAQHPEKAWVARALARALAVEAPREGILEAPRAGKDMDTRGTLQDTLDNPDTTFCDCKVVSSRAPCGDAHTFTLRGVKGLL